MPNVLAVSPDRNIVGGTAIIATMVSHMIDGIEDRENWKQNLAHIQSGSPGPLPYKVKYDWSQEVEYQRAKERVEKENLAQATNRATK
ncbi:hypothetical protein DdX_05867 [Ditylenchus destructor]|uniref:Uncharacterized protein n=1 Tax=Ditylenchus destructor TaxID=166010 RepID=A0AAD4N9Q6_9BILA|nr:hypothetical protein DdX_05867 [Ditylenchus destructor]